MRSRVIIFLILLLIAGNLFAMNIQRGEWLYERYCMSCHGQDGSGAAYGKGLKFTVRDLRPNYLLSSREIAFTIKYGLFERELLGKGETLTDKDIQDLTGYLRRFHYRPDIKSGKVLFVRYCSICHGMDGRGDKNFVTPDLTKSRVTDIEMARIIRHGRHDTAMINKKRLLYNTEIADIIEYLIALRNG